MMDHNLCSIDYFYRSVLGPYEFTEIGVALEYVVSHEPVNNNRAQRRIVHVFLYGCNGRIPVVGIRIMSPGIVSVIGYHEYYVEYDIPVCFKGINRPREDVLVFLRVSLEVCRNFAHMIDVHMDPLLPEDGMLSVCRNCCGG